MIPCGLDARDTLRLGAGMRLHGNDAGGVFATSDSYSRIAVGHRLRRADDDPDRDVDLRAHLFAARQEVLVHENRAVLGVVDV